MGIAMKQIREGQTVIDEQMSSGFESGSGFRDAFSRNPWERLLQKAGT